SPASTMPSPSLKRKEPSSRGSRLRSGPACGLPSCAGRKTFISSCWTETPPDPNTLTHPALADWVVDRHGEPLRPEPGQELLAHALSVSGPRRRSLNKPRTFSLE